MAVYSQNGYLANDISVTTVYSVGVRRFRLRKGPAGWLLWHFATWFDANIRNIEAGILDDWSYAERPIRGGTALSNHASGTAIDVDATKWPLGVAPETYLTPAEITKVRAQLTVYEGAIRWGGDYTGRKDPMHFEINRDEAFCARIQAKMQVPGGVQYEPRVDAAPGTRVLDLGKVGSDVGFVQRRIAVDPDDHFGPRTAGKVKETQASLGLAADGVVGPATWARFLPEGDEFDMASLEDLRRIVREENGNAGAELDYRGHHGNPKDNQYGHTLSIRKELAVLRAAVQALAESKGLSGAEIEALVRKLLAENVVKVDVNVSGAQPDAADSQ